MKFSYRQRYLLRDATFRYLFYCYIPAVVYVKRAINLKPLFFNKMGAEFKKPLAVFSGLINPRINPSINGDPIKDDGHDKHWRQATWRAIAVSVRHTPLRRQGAALRCKWFIFCILSMKGRRAGRRTPFTSHSQSVRAHASPEHQLVPTT